LSEPVTDVVVMAVEAAVQALDGAVDDPVPVEHVCALLQTAVIETYPWRFRPLFDRLIGREPTRRLVRLHLDWLVKHTDRGELLERYIDVLSRSTWTEAGDVLRTLARHPWLHYEAMSALDRRGEDTLDLDWARANHAGCCARREILRRIAPRLDARPDIRDWVLRHGGSIWPGDPFTREAVRASDGRLVEQPFLPGVAAARAVAGDLAGVLAVPDVDDELLDAARGIVADLLGDMGEDDIETCPDGVLIFDRLIGRLLDRCDTLSRLRRVQQIHDWLEWPPESAKMHFVVRLRGMSDEAWRAWRAGEWARRESLGWTAEIRAELTENCQRILRRPHWPDRIREAFGTYEPSSPDNKMRGWEGSLAWTIAPAVGVDLWEDGLRTLERFPLDSRLTNRLLDTDDSERVERAIRLAERLVPRALRAAQADGAPHGGLSAPGLTIRCLLQAMRRHPVYSERLVALALRIPGLHGLAVGPLERRPPDTWGEEVIVALRAAAGESSEPTRQRLLGLLALLG
jgi:hypothetical protein